MLSKEAINSFLNENNNLETTQHFKNYTIPEWEDIFMGFEFKTKPYKHQYACTYLGLIQKNFLYFASMGLGKTKIILDILSFKKKNNLFKKALILSPNILTMNTWAEQIKEHSNLSYFELTGSITNRWDEFFEKENTDLLLLNYTGLVMMLTDNMQVYVKKRKEPVNKWIINKEKIKKFREYYDTIVFDEIHLMKNRKSLTYEICNQISDKCTYRYGVTGTPMNRTPLDLWSIFHLVDKGYSLGRTLSLYREAFFTPKKRTWGYDFKKKRENYSVDYIFKKELESILQRKIGINSIRYSKEEALDLPEKVYIKREYTLPEENLKYYNMEKDLNGDSIEEIKNKYFRCRQICSGYTGYLDEYEDKKYMEFDENPKLELLIDLIKETEGKVVVALEYIKSGDIVCARLKKEKIKFERIYGETKDKVDTKDRFVQNKECKVLVGNIKSIGLGLDGLQKVCSYLFIYESPSSNIDRMQLEDRIHRGGQKNVTFIYDLVLKHKESVEEKILSFIREGKDFFQYLIDGRRRK
jgi:SNF2 family DNA or RNA helicase